MIHSLVGQKRRGNIQHRQIDRFTLAAYRSTLKRRQNRNGSVHSGHEIDDGYADLLWPPSGSIVAFSRNAHEAAHGLNGKIIGPLIRPGASLSKSRYGAVDKLGTTLPKCLGIQSISFQRTNLEVLNHNV